MVLLSALPGLWFVILNKVLEDELVGLRRTNKRIDPMVLC